MPQINQLEQTIQRPGLKTDSIEKKTEIKKNYVALILSFVAAATVFLPWFKMSMSGSLSFESFHQSLNYDYGSITGLQIGYIFCVFFSVIGGIIAFNNIKWGSVFGVINISCGLNVIFGWYNLTLNSNLNLNSNLAGVSANLVSETQYGLYLFLFITFLFVLATLLKNDNN